MNLREAINTGCRFRRPSWSEQHGKDYWSEPVTDEADFNIRVSDIFADDFEVIQPSVPECDRQYWSGGRPKEKTT